jgi:AcrR family transcriptional regulator
VFGRGGAEASTEDVAQLAGVGIATVFRHFPTKAALLEEVLVRRFTRLRDRAASTADVDDPWEAFAALFRYVVADAPGKIAIGEAIVEAGGVHERADAVAEEYRTLVRALIRRAQQAGAMRNDVAPDAVHALVVATSRAEAVLDVDAPARDRLVEIVLDGLRSGKAGG